ncbi:MAG: lipopolysaccharide kinase InaA family protein [Chthoniobacterales bacterium]
MGFADGRGSEDRWRRLTRSLALRDRYWCYSRRPTPRDPTQGWKLHLSATILSAPAVLAAVGAILRQGDVLFKVPRDLEQLRWLNKGAAGFSQIGKFLTAYPRSPEEAVALAAKLDRATRGLVGPEIPYDCRYQRSSLVYYRYGAFRASPQAPAGFIRTPKGQLARDRRAAGGAIPSGVVDPFRRRGAVRKLSGLIGTKYFLYRGKMQRGKGGVYEAIDFSGPMARLVIIKEGRRHGETDLAGEDGFTRVAREARVLRRLRAAGVAVPEVFLEFTQDRNRYLVLEKIPGRPLLFSRRDHPVHSSWRRARNILNQLEPLLASIHAAGWVWRDCKPSHIFRHRGRIVPIDFEGACRINDTVALPWSSPNYTSRHHERPRPRCPEPGKMTTRWA